MEDASRLPETHGPPQTSGPPWHIGDLGLGIIGGVAGAIPLFALLALAGLPDALSQTSFLAVASLMVYASFGVSLWFFTLRRKGAGLRAAGVENVSPLTLAGMVPVAIGALLLSGFVTVLVQSFLGDVPDVRDQVLSGGTEEPGRVDLMWLMIVGVLAAPIVEEFLFRGLLYRSMRMKAGAWMTAIATSLLFAVIHGQVLLIPSLFVLGMILAGLTERYKSIVPAIAVHALNNLAALVALAAMGID